MSSNVVFAYATFPTAELARQIAEQLVQEGVIACANIQAPHAAIYRWQGRMEHASETAVWFKLGVRKQEALIQRVRDLHPAIVPALVFFESAGGLPEFLNWVNAESL